MPKTLAALPLLLLAACASPSPGYMGVAPQRVVIEGTTIDVWRRGDNAQAIRAGWMSRAEQAAAPARLARAIETATGCALRPGTAEGDSAVLNARLDCPT